MDAAVFAGEWRPDTIQLLPLPASPAVFIQREIVLAQKEARRSEGRLFSYPDFVRSGELSSRSLGSNLGQASTQYVLSEVRSSQEQAEYEDLLVEGRFGVIQLSSDSLLGTPDLFQPSGLLLQEGSDPSGEQAAPDPQEGAETEPVAPEQQTPPAQSGDPVAATQGPRSPSFREQILLASSRRPQALRALLRL